jgi:hypothetical protein
VPGTTAVKTSVPSAARRRRAASSSSCMAGRVSPPGAPGAAGRLAEPPPNP